MFTTKKEETAEEKKAREEREARQREKEEKNPDYYRLFKSEYLENDGDFEIKLYRVETVGRGKRVKKYLKRYINDVPLEDDIGFEFGGGRFWIVGWDEDGEQLESYINISDHFTEEKKKREKLELINNQGQPDPLKYTSEIMKNIVQPMMEIVGAKNKKDDTPKVLETIAESFTKGLTTMQTAMIKQKIEHLRELDKRPSQPETEQMGWVKDVLNFAKPFINNFLTAEGKTKSWMRNILLKDERFQKIQEDDTLFKLVYSLGCKDPEIGKEKMDHLFSQAGFQVPEGEMPSEEEIAEEETTAAGNN